MRIRSQDTSQDYVSAPNALCTISGTPIILEGTPKPSDGVSHPGNGSIKFGGTNNSGLVTLDQFNQLDQCRSDLNPGTVGTITDYPSRALYKNVEHSKTTTTVRPGVVSEDYNVPLHTTRKNTVYETDWSLHGTNTWYNVVPKQGHLTKAEGMLDELDEGSEGLDLKTAWSRVTLGTQQAGFNLPQFAGELGEMRHLAAKPLKEIARIGRSKHKLLEMKLLLRRLKRRSRKAPTLKEFVKGLAASDITYQFVVKPFLADIDAMCDYQRHWNHQSKYIKEGVTLTAHGTAVYTDSITSDRTYERSIGTYDCYLEKGVDLERITTATVHYQLGPNFDGPSRLKSLGFNMPFTVAYELMPWSFAIDYLLNIGDLISGIERQINNLFVPANIIASGTSVKTTRRAHVIMQPRCPYFTDEGQYSGDCGAERVTTTYTRTADLGHIGLTPRLDLKLPSKRQILNLVDIAVLKALR
jgi:hypothetical protein